MRTDDAVVRVQTLGERWETLGVERFAGVRPENIQLTANDWGPDTAQFKMRREPGVAHPDLSAFTPCEIEIAGQPVWDGRVKETPSKEGSDAVVNVSSEGWQYHLDDDVYRSSYVVSDLTKLKDARSLLNADLTVWNPAGTVNVGDGKIVLGQAIGTAWASGRGQAVVLDMGSDSGGATSIGVTLSTLNTAGNATFTFIARGFDPDRGLGGWPGAFRVVDGSSPFTFESTQDAIYITNGNFNGTFFGTLPSTRYVALMLGWVGGGSGTTGADSLVTVSAIRVFSNNTYQQNSVSALRASDLVFDSAQRSAPMLKKEIKPNSYFDEVSADAGLYGDVSFATGGMRYWRMEGVGGVQEEYCKSTNNPLTTTGSVSGHQPGALSGDPNPSMLFSGGYADEVIGASVGRGPVINTTGRSWTAEAWIKRSSTASTGNYQLIVSMGAPAVASQSLWFGLTPNGFLAISHLSGDFVSAASVSDTNWHHVVGSFNIITRVFSIYLDGTLVGTQNLVTPTNASGPIRIGCAAWDTTDTFRGNIDEVAFYYNGQNDAYFPANLGMALSPQRVAWHYMAGQQRSNGAIQQTEFIIPQFDMESAQTPRQVIQAVNAFQNWRTRLRVGRELEFGPKPSSPLFVVGQWAGAEFEDASANSGEDVYNQVRIEAEDPAGNPLVVARQASTLTAPGAGVTQRYQGQAVNPDFETDVRNWTVQTFSGSGSFSRDTSAALSGVASGKYLSPGGTSGTVGAVQAVGDIQGIFRAGVTYTLAISVRWDGTAGRPYGYFMIQWGLMHPRSPSSGGYGSAWQQDVAILPIDPTATGPGVHSPVANGQWMTYKLPWTPKVDTPVSGSLQGVAPWYDVQVNVSFNQATATGVWNDGTVTPWNMPAGGGFHIDSAVIYGPGGNVLDKRGFRRTKVLPISNKMTVPAMQQIGDVWLRDHFTQPLKGSIAVHGQGGVRRLGSSLPLHPSALLTQAGELVRLSNAIDPDTGAFGRDGRIAGVQYDHDTRTAAVTLDNSRGNVEAFLARLAVVAK